MSKPKAEPKVKAATPVIAPQTTQEPVAQPQAPEAAQPAPEVPAPVFETAPAPVEQPAAAPVITPAVPEPEPLADYIARVERAKLDEDVVAVAITHPEVREDRVHPGTYGGIRLSQGDVGVTYSDGTKA